MLKRRVLPVLCLALVVGAQGAMAASTRDTMPETMDMLQHAIAFKTVKGEGQIQPFAEYLATKLKSAGFTAADIEIIPIEGSAGMIVTYKGSTAEQPFFIAAHMDVVPAPHADKWHSDPFKLTERDGYLYGRGAADMKSKLIAVVSTFMRLKREGFVPKRTMILQLSGGEEAGPNTTREMIRRSPKPEFMLNAESGGGIYNGQLQPVLYTVQAAEKTYADFTLEATSPGGHSSQPQPAKNAINRMAVALDRIAAYRFPAQADEITRGFLKATGEHEQGPVARAMVAFAKNPKDQQAADVLYADPAYIGQIGTTCIATMMSAGQARNALPQDATANVNCRIFPGVSVESVQATLTRLVDDPSITITARHGPVTPPSPLVPALMEAVAATVHERFPGVAVAPAMSAGATDGKYYREAGIPSYGVDSTFSKPDDERMHGVDERILAREIPASLDFWHSLLTRLGGK